MTKTTNYNLNQWDAADPIRREDFNADNAAIDAALAGVSGQIVIGSYTGDASTSWRTIELGFCPRFLIVTAQLNSNDTAFIAISGGSEATATLAFQDTGFAVRVASISYETYPLLNQNGRLYHYFAVR